MEGFEAQRFFYRILLFHAAMKVKGALHIEVDGMIWAFRLFICAIVNVAFL